MTVTLADTGPLFAYLSADDQNHDWAVRQFSAVRSPMPTCEAVLAETAILIAERGGRVDDLWSFLRVGVVVVDFQIQTEFESVAQLMRRYADQPMDLADACLVRMSEVHRDCRVFTTDGDFRIYRRHGRQVIPLICP